MDNQRLSEQLKEQILFEETFNIINTDIQQANKKMKKYKFSHVPKCLLQALIYYRKKNQSKVFEVLEGCSPQNDFYRGMKSYLLGLAHNHFGRFSFAIEHLEIASAKLEKAKSLDFAFYCWVILIISYSNRHDSKGVSQNWKKLSLYDAKSDLRLLSKIQCEVIYLLSKFQNKEAQDLLCQTLDNSDLSSLELFRAEFLMMLFSIRIQDESFEVCYQILDNYKQSSGFVVKSNYVFMKKMLDHIVSDQPLYVYNRDFEDSIESLHQIQVIKFLSEGSIEEAQQVWDILSLHNPKIYKNDFEFVGDKCLFSIALFKHSKKLMENTFSIAELEAIELPIDKLTYLFDNVNRPIDKYELVTLIWNEDGDDVSLSRLRKLITKYRRQSKNDVISVNSKYEVKKAS